MDKNKVSYIGVKGLIVNPEGRVLILQEPTHFVGGGKWELPGGKIANGEEMTPLETILKREVQEELGDGFQVQIGEIIDVMRRPWNKAGATADQVMLVVFKCEYKGGDIKLSDENINSAWITQAELPNYEYIAGYLPVLEKFFKKS
jgi:8-oxo-dGTP pyrophosphatase MutT (NUDIX family)